MWEAFKINCLGGLREEVTREVRRHLRTNPAIRNVPQPFGYRMLKKFCGRGGLLSFLLRYVVLYAFFLIGCATIVTFAPEWVPKSDQGFIDQSQAVTSYFLAAQAVMIGLLFPVAVGVITLITQREDASSTVSDLQVYYSESFAFGVGASGIALSIALAVHVFWPARYPLEYLGFNPAGTYFEVVVLIVHLLWLLVNFFALWHFLFTSLSFMRPAQRALMRRRYAALAAIPGYLTASLMSHQYYVGCPNALAKLVGRGKNSPAHFLGSTFERGEIEICKPCVSGATLGNVWLTPLKWGMLRWLKRCEVAEKSNANSSSEPELIFYPSFRGPLSEDGVLCRRIGGVPFNKFERFLISISFRFERKKS